MNHIENLIRRYPALESVRQSLEDGYALLEKGY